MAEEKWNNTATEHTPFKEVAMSFDAAAVQCPDHISERESEEPDCQHQGAWLSSGMCCISGCPRLRDIASYVGVEFG